MKKSVLILALLFTSIAFSQRYSDIRPFKADIKIGLPGLLGINAEYITPALNNRLSFFASYSGFTSNFNYEEVDEKVRYFELGSNFYLSENGKGLYGSLGYGNMNIDGTYYEVPDGEDVILEAVGNFKANTINVKAGLLLGGLIFFRGEIGYGFGNIPTEVEVHGRVNEVRKTVIIERPEYPGMSDSGYVLATVGVGVAF